MYENLLEEKLKVIRRQLIRIRNEMRNLRIKVQDSSKVNEVFIKYYFTAHGYEETMRFWTSAMKYEGTRRLTKIFSSHTI